MTKIALCGAIIGLNLLAQDALVDQKLAAEKLAQRTLATIQNDVINVRMITGKTVKGAPYSAEATNETVQVLADGNRIVQSNSTRLYRDSQGRERREEMAADGTARSIFISDPVEGVTYTLRPETKVAVRNFAPHITADEQKKAAERKLDAASLMKEEVATVTMDSTGSGDTAAHFVFRQTQSGKAEDLGTQMIEGVSAAGTRRTNTIAAGEMGNTLPIVTVNERWVSPDLQVLVLSTRTDPRTGTYTYKLTNIDRSEPAPTLFEVPADYKLKDLTQRVKPLRPEEQQ